MIVAGTVTMKMAIRVKKLYEQMADPNTLLLWDLVLQVEALLAAWLSCS